jgi:hypothetical protein
LYSDATYHHPVDVLCCGATYLDAQCREVDRGLTDFESMFKGFLAILMAAMGLAQVRGLEGGIAV